MLGETWLWKDGGVDGQRVGVMSVGWRDGRDGANHVRFGGPLMEMRHS
jgi:hypothetical protein